MTSHAAVVARGMGKPCVSGCQAIEVDGLKETVTLPDGKVLKKGDVITIDGATGEVMLGAVPLVRSTGDADFQQVWKGERGSGVGCWVCCGCVVGMWVDGWVGVTDGAPLVSVVHHRSIDWFDRPLVYCMD
jgi:hypothetical protein